MEVPFYTSLKLEHDLQKLNEMFIPTTIMYTIYIYITSNFKLVVLLSFSGRMNLSKCLFPACISIVKTKVIPCDIPIYGH